MPVVYNINGRKVQFQNEPTEADIDEAAKGLIDNEPFGKILQKNALNALSDVHKNVFGPVAGAASALAFDIPRALMKMQINRGEPGATQAYDFLFPEQTNLEGKAVRAALETRAILQGGAGKVAGNVFERTAPKAAQTGLKKFVSHVGQGAATGFTFGALTAKPTLDEYIKNVEGNTAFGAVLPVAGKASELGVQGLGKFGRFISKNVGGVTDATVDIIHRLGADRVFDPLKAKADYIGTTIIPKVKDRIVNLIFEMDIKAMNALKNMGFGHEDVLKIKQLNPEYKAKLAAVLRGDNVNIKNGVDSIFQDAGDRYATIMAKVNPNTAIDIKDFYYTLRNSLRNKGWLTSEGLPTEKIGSNPTRDKLLSIYDYLGRNVKGRGTGGYASFKLNVPEFENVRNAVDTAYSGIPANDHILPKLGKKIRGSASRVIPGMENVNKLYSDALTLKELEGKNLFTNSLDPAKLESKVMQIQNIYRTKRAEPVKNIIGQDIYDDVLAHFANRDFGLTSDIPGAGGGIYPSRSGFLRAGVSEATKKYYKDVLPSLNKLSGKFSGIKTNISNYYKEPLSFNAVKPIEIPIFKRTGEAEAFGRQNAGNVQVLKRLTTLKDEALEKSKALKALENPTDAQIQEGYNLGVKAQYYREAMDAAQGKSKTIKGFGKLGALALGGIAASANNAQAALSTKAQADERIDMDKIYQIESSGDPKAFNANSNARGLGQITPIVLREWNNFHGDENYGPKDLFEPSINKKISNWYMNVRIPKMLEAYKLPDTPRNRLISYNAGISYVKGDKDLPQETINYLRKYGLE